jgi:hypothetical protein
MIEKQIIRTALTLLLTICLGLLSRLFPIGWHSYDKSLGDVLYAVAVYLVLALVFYRTKPVMIACLALVLCVAIECFKLTGIPVDYGDLLIVRWVLGTTFSWHNVGCYGVGVVVIAGVDMLALLQSRKRAAKQSR